MHEYNITNEVVHQILHACEDNNIDSPKKIVVELGELTTYKKDSVLYYFEGFKKDNDTLKNTSLEINMIRGKIFCNNCKKESLVSPLPVILCPKCDSFEIKFIEGDKIKITKIE